MKNDLTTGEWQHNIGCPISIVLFSTSDDPSRLSSQLLRAIYLVLKTASRDAEEVIKVSLYIFLDSISSNNVIVWENLLFPLLALVGDQAPRKGDGTDFGWV